MYRQALARAVTTQLLQPTAAAARLASRWPLRLCLSVPSLRLRSFSRLPEFFSLRVVKSIHNDQQSIMVVNVYNSNWQQVPLINSEEPGDQKYLNLRL